MKQGQSGIKRSRWLPRGQPGNLPEEGEVWVGEKRLTTGKVQPSPSAGAASNIRRGGAGACSLPAHYSVISDTRT
jgi:hypothetical protein